MKTTSTSFTKRRWARVLGIILVALIALVIGLQFALAPTATRLVNDALAKSLVPEARLDRIRTGLFRGFVQVEGLNIAQPEGFGDGSFLSLGKAWVDVRLASLAGEVIHINRIGIDKLSVAIITDTNGIMNISMLTPAEPAEPKAEEPPEEAPEPGKPPPAFKIHKISVDRLSLTYLDQSASHENPIEINLRDAEIRIHDTLFDPAKSDLRELIGAATFTGRLEHSDTPPTHFGLTARYGPLSTGIPGMVASLVIAGVELSAAGSIVPRGVATTLGGDVIDLVANIELTPDLLSVRAYVETSGARFPVTVSGTPNQPRVESGAILLGAFGRVGGVVGNTLGNVAGAGLQVGEGAVNVAASVGKGAVNIVSGVGRGLFSTAKSAATLDIKGVGEGLTDSVTSVGQGALDTVTDVGSTALSTVQDAARKSTGISNAEQWRDEKQSRFDSAWETAQTWVNQATYPAASSKLLPSTPEDEAPVESTP